MMPIETLPIYFPTDDKRINAYLAKNRLHHELCTLCNPVYQTSLKIRAINEGGNGRIRGFLLGCAVVTLYLFFAMQSWGWI